MVSLQHPMDECLSLVDGLTDGHNAPASIYETFLNHFQEVTRLGGGSNDARLVLELLVSELTTMLIRCHVGVFQAKLAIWAKSRAKAVSNAENAGDAEEEEDEDNIANRRWIGLDDGRELFLELVGHISNATTFVNQCCQIAGLHSGASELCDVSKSVVVAVRTALCSAQHTSLYTPASTSKNDGYRPLLLLMQLEAKRLLHNLANTDPTSDGSHISKRVVDAGCRRAWEAIHFLGLCENKEVEKVWIGAVYHILEERMDREFKTFVEEDSYVSIQGDLMLWRETVADPFFLQTLPGHFSNNISSRNVGGLVQRAEELQAHIHISLGERYCKLIFGLMFHFPADLGAFEDLRECLAKQEGLLGLPVESSRAAHRDNLHNPGTKTESILKAIIAGVKAFCFLVPRSEQGPVVAQVFSDTLHYFQSRKDAAIVLMRALTDSSPDAPLTIEMQTYAAKDADAAISPQRGGRGVPPSVVESGNVVDDEEVFNILHGCDESKTPQEMMAALQPALLSLRKRRGRSRHQIQNASSLASSTLSSKHIPPPHLLQLLLSVVPISAVIGAFEQQLAQQVVDTRIPGQSDSEVFATLEHESTVERLKHVFGDEELLTASIIIRDIKESRRSTAAAHEIMRRDNSEVVLADVVAISATRWPPLDPHGVIPPFELHPSLTAILDAYGAAFTKFAPAKEVVFYNTHGTVCLHVTQWDGTATQDTPFHLLPFLATTVLHLFDLQNEANGGSHESIEPMPFPMSDVLERMGLDADDDDELLYFLIRLATVYDPALFILDRVNGTIALQTIVQ